MYFRSPRKFFFCPSLTKVLENEKSVSKAGNGSPAELLFWKEGPPLKCHRGGQSGGNLEYRELSPAIHAP